MSLQFEIINLLSSMNNFKGDYDEKTGICFNTI